MDLHNASQASRHRRSDRRANGLEAKVLKIRHGGAHDLRERTTTSWVAELWEPVGVTIEGMQPGCYPTAAR
jgi:hypothetical protein